MRRQSEGNGSREIAGLRIRSLRPAFGIELQVCVLPRLHANQGSFYLLLDSIRQNDLMKGDAQLSILLQAACWLYLADGAQQAAALRIEQTVTVKKRARKHGFHFLALRRACRGQCR